MPDLSTLLTFVVAVLAMQVLPALISRFWLAAG